MQSKITLYADKKLIKQIKAYAKAHNVSVSKLVSTYFAGLLRQDQYASNDKMTDTITQRLKGRLSDSGVDEKDYRDYLEKKYL